MNEEAFNLGIRKFLKQFGVAAQRAIEDAARSAPPGRPLKLRATLQMDGRSDACVQQADIQPG